MELHVRPQLEFPGRVVDRLPRQREAGLGLEVLVLQHQRVEEVLRHLDVGIEGVELRIERRGLGLDADLEFLRLRLRGA